MTASLALVVFSGCLLLIFQTEEHKNKRIPLILECSCKWICGTFLNQCFAPAVYVYDCLLLWRTEGSFFCLFRHDGHSDVWAEAGFCTNCRMDIVCILMFFCSCVFIIIASWSCWLCAVVEIRSLVLARDDGVGALVQNWVLLGKTQSCALLGKRALR